MPGNLLDPGRRDGLPSEHVRQERADVIGTMRPPEADQQDRVKRIGMGSSNGHEPS